MIKQDGRDPKVDIDPCMARLKSNEQECQRTSSVTRCIQRYRNERKDGYGKGCKCSCHHRLKEVVIPTVPSDCG